MSLERNSLEDGRLWRRGEAIGLGLVKDVAYVLSDVCE